MDMECICIGDMNRTCCRRTTPSWTPLIITTFITQSPPRAGKARIYLQSILCFLNTSTDLFTRASFSKSGINSFTPSTNRLVHVLSAAQRERVRNGTPWWSLTTRCWCRPPGGSRLTQILSSLASWSRAIVLSWECTVVVLGVMIVVFIQLDKAWRFFLLFEEWWRYNCWNVITVCLFMEFEVNKQSHLLFFLIVVQLQCQYIHLNYLHARKLTIHFQETRCIQLTPRILTILQAQSKS